MTREQLDAIRVRVEREQVRLRGKPVVADFGAVSFVDISADLLAEVERLTADPLPAAAWVREVERAAFQRGVAAMREVAAQRCEISPIHGEKTTTARKYADAVRALPDPEDRQTPGVKP